MNYKNIVPIIDTRENKNHLFTFSGDLGTPLRKKLDTGDYSVAGLENILAIERKKTVSEISININEKRYVDWTARLATFKYAFIVCEFSFFELMNYPQYEDLPPSIKKKIRVSGKYIAARLVDLNLKYPNINIIYAGNKKYAEQLTELLMVKTYVTCQ